MKNKKKAVSVAITLGQLNALIETVNNAKLYYDSDCYECGDFEKEYEESKEFLEQVEKEFDRE